VAVTTTTSLSNSVQKLFNKDYLMATTGQDRFDQLTWTRQAMGSGARGSSVD